MELKFKHYIDIVITKDGFELEKKSLRDMKNIIKKIHFFNKNNKNFVLSFPNYKMGEEKTLGNVMRLFSNKEEDLNFLKDDFKNTWYLENMKISNIKTFKITDDTVFYEYTKFKVPVKNSKRPSLKEGYREERLIKADNYPFVVIDSLSTNQKFSLIIKREEIKKEDMELFKGQANNYGLSSSLSRVAIPSINF